MSSSVGVMDTTRSLRADYRDAKMDDGHGPGVEILLGRNRDGH